MSSKILEGMARASRGIKQNAVVHSDIQFLIDTEKPDLRAALLWLADNVSDEMVKAFWDQFYSVRIDSPTNKAIAAAIRQAAGGE